MFSVNPFVSVTSAGPSFEVLVLTVLTVIAVALAAVVDYILHRKSKKIPKDSDGV